MEGLTRAEGDFLAAGHAHHDSSFQDVDEAMGIVAMHRIGATRWVFHGKDQRFLAGLLRQGAGHHFVHQGLGRSRGRGGGSAAQWQQRKQGQNRTTHGRSPVR